MNKRKYLYSTVYLMVLLALTGCSASLKIKAQTAKDGSLSFSMDMGPILTETIKQASEGMAEMSGQEDGKLFSEPEIVQTFSGTNLEDIKASVPALSKLEVDASYNSGKGTSGSKMEVSKFVSGTASSVTLTLSAENMQELAKSAPEVTMSYIDLLMAPVFTGDTMTEKEYLDLVASVYGEKMAKEIELSGIDITLCAPQGKNIKKASSQAKISGNEATFRIPVTAFLTIQKPVAFTAEW